MGSKGRPRLAENARRNGQINIAVNAAELEKIQMLADLSGKPPAVLVRDRAISSRRLVIVPRVNQAVLGRLRELKLLLVQASLRLAQMSPQLDAAEYLAAAAAIIDDSILRLSDENDAGR